MYSACFACFIPGIILAVFTVFIFISVLAKIQENELAPHVWAYFTFYQCLKQLNVSWKKPTDNTSKYTSYKSCKNTTINISFCTFFYNIIMLHDSYTRINTCSFNIWVLFLYNITFHFSCYMSRVHIRFTVFLLEWHDFSSTSNRMGERRGRKPTQSRSTFAVCK